MFTNNSLDSSKNVYDMFSFVLWDATNYFEEVVLCFCYWLVAYLVLCGVVYLRNARSIPAGADSPKAKRALIVTAHPDDECMFFGPTIYRLCEQSVSVHLLCLSNGNYEGLGQTRRFELWAACEELGIQQENVCLMNDSRLPDNPEVDWPVNVVAQVLQFQIESLDIDTLITFDRGGVSSHKNHCAIFYAVAYMFVQKRLPSYCAVYTLDTVNVLRKYWSFLDLPISIILSSKRYFLSWSESGTCARAMRRHGSQLRWFRRAYVALSRYMVANTLRRLQLADVELELELDE